MSLILYSHPLASFCHKVLMALGEKKLPFETVFVDFSDPGDTARILDFWPVGKIPILHDEDKHRTLPESSIIIEYLDQHYPGALRLLPVHETDRLEARLWDRFYDNYVQTPMQKIVIDRLRPPGASDAHGVAEARASLQTAYAMIEERMRHRFFAAGDDISIADCAAAPALFYAGIVEPFQPDHEYLKAYFERLLDRPSFQRVLKDAQPYFKNFPYVEAMPQRFLS